MAPELTPEIKETVKATVPVLKEHGRAIITRFYSILFERYPQVQRYFNMYVNSMFGHKMIANSGLKISGIARARESRRSMELLLRSNLSLELF